MRRKQGIAALLAGALILLGLLAVFAIELSNNQAKSRHNLETQAHQRALLVAGLMDEVFAQQGRVGLDARAALSAPQVSSRAVDDVPGDKRYAALLAMNGQLVAHADGFTAADRRDLDAAGSLKLLAGGRDWGASDVRPGDVVNVVTRIATPRGDRALVTGIPLSSFSQFALTELRKVPGVQGQHQLIVDGHGVVVASTVADRPVGYVFHSKLQLHVLRGVSGVFHAANGVRYIDSVAFGNTNWKLILSVPTSEFFASVSGFRHYLPWIIFIAFGLVALAALGLVARAISAAERIRGYNDQLVGTNAELNDAHVRLEEVNGTLAVTNGALERSNDELERQAEELVRSNTELDQFASIASHDLQEPLRKVRTFTERISETEAGNLSERGIDYLRRANASAERMQTLIEDLLRYSRVSTHGRPFAPVDLAKVTEDVLDDLSEAVERSGATVKVGDLPTINADAPQMRQLMQNLISNALKFRRDGVDLEVIVDAEQEPGWVTISVADNGIGFDPQYSRRIFRVFERLHGRGTYPGTGIGLALCRKIAERHGGTVVATGVPDEGATFAVTMQTQRTEAVSDGVAPSRSDDGSPQQEPYVTV